MTVPRVSVLVVLTIVVISLGAPTPTGARRHHRPRNCGLIKPRGLDQARVLIDFGALTCGRARAVVLERIAYGGQIADPRGSWDCTGQTYPDYITCDLGNFAQTRILAEIDVRAPHIY